MQGNNNKSNDKNTYEDAPLMDHDYDGIREFDNSLPGWWLATFYIAIVFAIAYFGYYILGSGPTLVEELNQQLKQAEFAKLSQQAPSKGPDEKQLTTAFQDPEQKKKGKAIFQVRCVACHGPEGQGGIGPNLTDNYWIHGGTLADIAKTVSTGVPDKGMPTWKALISNEEIISVVVFVKSLKGTNPPNPKAPQGDLESVARLNSKD